MIFTGATQALVASIALPVAMACLCRLAMLNIMQHRTSVCLLHACVFGGALSSLFRAATFQAGGNDLLYLSAAGLWLSITLPMWSHGVPPMALRRAHEGGST